LLLELTGLTPAKNESGPKGPRSGAAYTQRMKFGQDCRFDRLEKLPLQNNVLTMWCFDTTNYLGGIE
jgi:hypothetical protein